MSAYGSLLFHFRNGNVAYLLHFPALYSLVFFVLYSQATIQHEGHEGACANFGETTYAVHEDIKQR